MAELLLTKDLVIEGKYEIPNMNAYAGDVVWVETENNFYSEIFISSLLGLLRPSRGELKFFSSDVSYCDITEWLPNIKDASSLCRLYSYSRGVQMSASISEFKRILSQSNAEHVLNMHLKDMVRSTRSLLSWAISLSVPALNVILNDPYYGLDKEASLCLSNEIENCAKDGSLVIIVSQEKPSVFNKQVSFR